MVRKPIGVVAAITPWNFPIFCSVAKFAPAIVLGNTVVWKPSPFTPLTALRMGEILQSALPPGVLNVVTGDDTQRFNVGAHLTNHAGVSKVSFTRNTQPRTQDAHAQTVEKGETATTSREPALGPRKANARAASSVSSS